MEKPELQTGWQWFCGLNSSDIDNSGGFNLENGHGNTCFVDALDIIPHLGFLVLATAVLVLGCCTRYRSRRRSEYLIRFPGHSLRWCLSITLLIILLASLAEGILTDETYIQGLGSTQPHLYLPSIFTLAGVVISLVYHQHMEAWQAGGMSFLLLVYYAAAALGEVGKLINLVELDQGSMEIVRFDLTILQLACFLLLLFIEVNTIRLKVGQVLKTNQHKPKIICVYAFQ